MMPLPPHPRQLLGMCLSWGSEALAQGRTWEPAGCTAAAVVFGQGNAPFPARQLCPCELQVKDAGTGFWCC